MKLKLIFSFLSFISLAYAAEETRQYLPLGPYINWAREYNPIALRQPYGEWAAIKIKQTLHADRRQYRENEGRACALFFAAHKTENENDINLDLANNILQLLNIQPLEQVDSFINLFKSFARSKSFDALLYSFEQSQSVDSVYSAFKRYLSIAISNPKLVEREQDLEGNYGLHEPQQTGKKSSSRKKRKTPLPGVSHFKIPLGRSVKRPKKDDTTTSEQLASAALDELRHSTDVAKDLEQDVHAEPAKPQRSAYLPTLKILNSSTQANNVYAHSSLSITYRGTVTESVPFPPQSPQPPIENGNAQQFTYPRTSLTPWPSVPQTPYFFLAQTQFVTLGDQVVVVESGERIDK